MNKRPVNDLQAACFVLARKGSMRKAGFIRAGKHKTAVGMEMLYRLSGEGDCKRGAAEIIEWKIGDDFGEYDVQTFSVTCMGRAVEVNV